MPMKNLAPGGGYRLSQRYGDDDEDLKNHDLDDRIDRLDDDIETLQASY